MKSLRSFKPRAFVNRAFAQELADAFAAVYSGQLPIVIENERVGKMVASEIDRQRRAVNAVNAEYKRVDPAGFERRLRALRSSRGADVAFFELRREVANSMHLPLALVDYSWHHKKLEVSSAGLPGYGFQFESDFRSQIEPGARTLSRIVNPGESFVTGRERLSKKQAMRELLKSMGLDSEKED